MSNVLPEEVYNVARPGLVEAMGDDTLGMRRLPALQLADGAHAVNGTHY
jgi:hypothetical protein